MKRLKAVSIQSIIIGSVITGVIALSGLAALWPSVEKSKIYTIAETLDEQDAYIVSQIEFDYKNILTLHVSGDGDEDYLDELIGSGQISSLPYNLFKSPDSLVWEIRAVLTNGTPEFYWYLDTSDSDDLALILSGREYRGML